MRKPGVRTSLYGLLFIIAPSPDAGPITPSPGADTPSPGAETPASNYYLPLDRPFTLRHAEPFVLERELARQIQSDGPMSFIFPRPCFSEIDSSRVCGEAHGFSYLDADRRRFLSISPLLGYEYRYRAENVNAFDGGLLATGSSGPVSFYLDARTFTELHENFAHASHDREFVERQDEDASASIAYSSYSRYRSNLSLDLSWARLSAGREAAHWGPGVFGNLVFNQQAIPFNQISWTSHLGPVSVMTLYGQLSIHGDSLGSFNKSLDTRSIYAHRYEWRVIPDLLFGVSEQLVVYNREEPFAFVPVVPLFILKGTGVERNNNGNISADITYRLGGRASFHTEFFVDDVQSPTSIFNHFWGNKWAWMAGLHATHPVAWGRAGLLVEYSRVEPWVYTHYKPGTAQSAHGGHPLGNPQGPNSQWMVAKPYFRGKGGWYLSLRTDLIWKGDDPGSAVGDTGVDETRPKAFIRGIERPEARFSPYAAWGWKSLYWEALAALGRRPEIVLRAHWQY